MTDIIEALKHLASETPNGTFNTSQIRTKLIKLGKEVPSNLNASLDNLARKRWIVKHAKTTNSPRICWSLPPDQDVQTKTVSKSSEMTVEQLAEYHLTEMVSGNEDQIDFHARTYKDLKREIFTNLHHVLSFHRKLAETGPIDKFIFHAKAVRTLRTLTNETGVVR